MVVVVLVVVVVVVEAAAAEAAAADKYALDARGVLQFSSFSSSVSFITHQAVAAATPPGETNHRRHALDARHGRTKPY